MAEAAPPRQAQYVLARGEPLDRPCGLLIRLARLMAKTGAADLHLLAYSISHFAPSFGEGRPKECCRMLRRITIGLLTAAAVLAGPTAHAFAFSGGVSHVVTHPLAVSTTMPTEHPADVRLDADANHYLDGYRGHAR